IPLSPQRKAAFLAAFLAFEREWMRSPGVRYRLRFRACRERIPLSPQRKAAFLAAFLAFERVWMRIPRIVESVFPLFLYSLIFVVPLHQNTEIHSSDFSIVLISMLISF
ncbi:MAG: hypothetical protein J6X74_06610, partial [Bacteroidaceae bacterium]|nr:hypothetical protein [Bacteroidaceae bacterium]